MVSDSPGRGEGGQVGESIPRDRKREERGTLEPGGSRHSCPRIYDTRAGICI